MTARPGLILAAIFLCIYGTLAVVVNLPKATYGFKSDEATYYMIGLSLAYDGDFAYRKEDLVRVWREFPSGPTGVFLTRGQTVGLFLREKTLPASIAAGAAPHVVLMVHGGFAPATVAIAASHIGATARRIVTKRRARRPRRSGRRPSAG